MIRGVRSTPGQEDEGILIILARGIIFPFPEISLSIPPCTQTQCSLVSLVSLVGQVSLAGPVSLA
jgi:hypothetical protein